MSDNDRIMAFTKQHFNVKPNIGNVACRPWKRAHLLKESSDVDMREETWVKFLTWNVHPVHTASVVVSVNTVQAVKMQLMWSLCKHSIIMSQIVANWALFNFPLFSDGTLWFMKKQSKMWSGHAFLECNLLKQCMTSCIERHAINTRSAIDPTTGFWRNVGTKHYVRLFWSACKARTLALPKIRTFRDWTFACVSIHHALLGLQEWGQPRWTTPKPGDSRAKGLFREDHFHFHQSVKNQTVMVSTWLHPLLQTYHT